MPAPARPTATSSSFASRLSRHRWLVRSTFAVAALLAVTAGILATHRLNEARHAGEWVQHTAEVLDAIHEIRSAIAAIDAAKHAVLRAAPEPTDSAHHIRTMAALQRVRERTADNRNHQQTLDTLEDLIQEELSELSLTVALVQRGQVDSARVLVRDTESEHRADAIERQLLRVTGREHDLLRARTEDHSHHASHARVYVTLALGASIVLAGLGALIIRRGERRARRSEGRFRAALDAMFDPFFIARPVGSGEGPREFEIVEANEAGADLARSPRVELLGGSLGAVLPEGLGAAVITRCREVIATGARHAAEYRFHQPNAGDRWLKLQVVPTEEGVAVTCHDITSSKQAEAALAALAVRDELTGLLNRRGFRELAEQHLRVARRVNRADAVLSLDLNGFKQINDTFGHAEGDSALREVSRILTATLREVDVLARFGGDEFVVYAPGADVLENGGVIAARLAEAFAVANVAAVAAGRPYGLHAGIGVALLEAGDTLDALLAKADAELYAQKKSSSIKASRR
jgi:diguanylate cyclase (GGDEF)-like protein